MTRGLEVSAHPRTWAVGRVVFAGDWAPQKLLNWRFPELRGVCTATSLGVGSTVHLHGDKNSCVKDPSRLHPPTDLFVRLFIYIPYNKPVSMSKVFV